MCATFASQLIAALLIREGGAPPVRGFMIHGTKKEYIARVLDACKRYGINHLELAGDNPTFTEQVPGSAALLEEMCAKAKSKGIETYVWVRELNTKERTLSLDPKSESGKAFWDKRLGMLRQAFASVPSLSGGVMSYASTPTEIWYVNDPSSFWQSKTMPERIRFVNDQFKSVLVGELGKRMFVRDFNHSPQQLKWLVDGLRDADGFTMYSKWEPQDWQLFYPDSFAIGAFGKTPQVIEADLGAEYWGRSMVPVSLVRQIKKRWDYDRSHGASGIVARIDRDEESCLGTPSEVNLYALSRYLKKPETTPEEVYKGWLKERYKVPPGSKTSEALIRIYERGFEQAKLQWFTLGFWTPKDQTEIPVKIASIEGAILGKSTALWDPAAKPVEQRLAKPDELTVREILRDRDRAIALAQKNLEEFERAHAGLRPADEADWRFRLDLSLRFAKVWRLMADAVWSLRLVETQGKLDQAGLAMLESKVKQFVEAAPSLQVSGPSQTLRDRIAGNASKLGEDVLTRARALVQKTVVLRKAS